MRKNLKKVLAISLLSCCLISQSVIADEQNAVQTTKETGKNIKTVPHKSFFKKFSKKKTEDNRSTHPVVNEIPLYETGIVYDIDDCIRMGLERSPYIKNLKDTKQAQKHEVNSAKSNYFPSITASAGYNYGRTHYSGDGYGGSLTTRNRFGFDVGLSEMIFDFGRTIAQINMHKYNYEAAGYDLEDGILDTVFDIRIAYTKVLAERASRHVLIQNVKINELNVERTKAMYEVGLRSKIDLVNAEGNLTTAEIALLEGEKKYRAALINLNDSMYYMNPPIYSLKPTGTFNLEDKVDIKNEINVAFNKESYEDGVDLSIKDGSIYKAGIEKRSFIEEYHLNPYPLTLQETMDRAFSDRHDLKAMKLLKKVAEESLKVVKRSWFPQLNVSANYGLGVNSKDTSGNMGNVTNSVSLYGGLDFPMINGMYIKNQVDIAKLNVDKAQNNITLLENEIYFEIESLFISMKQLEQKIPLLRKRVEQFRENFELADGRYAVGLGDYIALQQSITDYNNAQLTFIEAVFQYNLARYELERAMAVAYSK